MAADLPEPGGDRLDSINPEGFPLVPAQGGARSLALGLLGAAHWAGKPGVRVTPAPLWMIPERAAMTADRHVTSVQNPTLHAPIHPWARAIHTSTVNMLSAHQAGLEFIHR
jgi:hypothetical protein